MGNKLILILILFFLTGEMAWAGTITGRVTFLGNPKNQAAVHLEGITEPGVLPKKHAVVVQKNQVFIPEVLPVYKGTTVDFPNRDTVYHNAFSISEVNPFLLEKYGPGENPKVKFNKIGKVDIFCNFHSQMHGVILVLDHPYFSLTTKKGEFEIKNVPEGTYRIKAWANSTFSEENIVTVGQSKAVVDFNITKIHSGN